MIRKKIVYFELTEEVRELITNGSVQLRSGWGRLEVTNRTIDVVRGFLHIINDSKKDFTCINLVGNSYR